MTTPRDTVIYLERRVEELWKEYQKAKTVDGKAALLMSIGELMAEERRLEKGSGPFAVGQ